MLQKKKDNCNRNSVGLPQSKGCQWNVGDASWALLSRRRSRCRAKLWCDAWRRRRLNFALLRNVSGTTRNLETWNVRRKPNAAGILRAWVRSEPPVLAWLLLEFQLLYRIFGTILNHRRHVYLTFLLGFGKPVPPKWMNFWKKSKRLVTTPPPLISEFFGANFLHFFWKFNNFGGYGNPFVGLVRQYCYGTNKPWL